MLINKITKKNIEIKNFIFLLSFTFIFTKAGPKIKLNKVPENDPNVKPANNNPAKDFSNK